MNLRRKDFGDAGDVVFGLTQTANPDTASLASDLLVVPGQMAYMHIPATELRNFVDGLAPSLAKNQIADCASGYGHRYMAGHDLLLDVPATFSSHGAGAGVKHAGHIILTDFPTKAGIPIPGFSHSGLGQLLEQAGIAKGWLQISLFDTGVGVFAFADGATNLIQALQGSLLLDFGTACQTFGMGSVEIGFAVATQNPMLLAGGVQNVLAGLVSTWQTITVYVDPLDFLGAGGTSALLGFAVAHGLAGESLTDATLTAVRSGSIGALFAVSSAFGFGALAGFVACQLGRTLAQSHNRAASERLTVDRNSYELLIKELVAGNPLVGELIERAMPNWGVPEKHALLNANAPTIDASFDILSSAPMILKTAPRVLSDAPRELSSIGLRIENDPDELLTIYRRAGLR
ncbi:MAG: hypothetical protein KBF98_01445 [Rhodoferax sp.]|nr:hypothetical protein [Rhodoferax sp.]